jgi:hypothetical protein
MSITLRNIKGSPLTHEEMDENFSALTGSLGAGDGLTGGGFLPTGVEFNVGQGDGISVSADSIAVNSTVARTGSNVFTGPQNIQSALTASSALLGGFTYPTTDSSYGFVLATDGSGNLFFQQATSGSITSSGAIFPFTGSAGILGSLNVDGTITATTSLSGSFIGPSINVTSGSFTRLDATTGNIVTLTGTTSTFTSASFTRLDVTGNSTLDGDLTVTGRVTAEEFHTEFVSASIIYQSGSTKFGDTSDDRHSFTGSVEILGSLTGSSNIDIAGTVDANVYSINGTTVVDSSRNITGSNGVFTGDVDVANLDSSGNVDANTFSIDGSTVIDASENITGTSLDVTGEVEGNTFAVDGTTIVDASRNFTGSNAEFTGEVVVGSLDSSGNVDANTISIDGSTVIDASENITGTSLDVTGEVQGNSISIDGSTVIDASENITGASLDVTGEVEGNTFAVDGTIIVDANRNFTGSNAEFTGDVIVGSLDSSGNVDANTFSIDGSTVIDASENITGASLDVSGEVEGNSFAINNDTVITSGRVINSITQANVDNLRLDGNTLSNTATDQNVTIEATGTGILDVNVGSNFQNLLTVQNDIYPEQNYVSNIGAINKKFLSLNVAELIVETLVASERRSTVGGRFNVGIGTQLSQSISPSSASILVENNNLNSGDIIHLETGGNVEFMRVDSAASSGSGDGFSYDVTRNLDGTGANTFDAGSGVFNTGQIGNGFIDQYAINSLTTGVNTAGPTIAFMERTGSAFQDIDVRTTVGNLKGWYGYSTEIFGFAAGNYKEQNITVDPINGLRIRNVNTLQLQASGSTLTIGDNFIFNSSTGLLKVSGSNIELESPTFFLGNNSQFISGSNGNLRIESTNFTLAQNGDVSMTGTVTAEAGQIGGFAITDSAITGSGFFLSGSATGNQFFISASNFNVKANGDITASNADISGNINAETGTIGGFNIATDLTAGSGLLTLKGTSGQITGSNVLFTGGKISGSAIEFDVTNFVAKGDTVEISGSSFHLLNGNVTASNVDLSGNINAQTGTIGGFSISEDALSSGNNFFISGSATNNEFFISSSKFNVKANGDVTASNANITGDIVATNITAINQGNIAGFTLTANQLSDSGNNLVLKSSGQITGSNVLFTGGKISGSAIEFDVTKFVAKGNNVEISGSSFHLLNGNITASNVDLSGEINAESGTIGGFNIGSNLSNSAGSTLILKGATGQITASAAQITGNITATSGQIAGFTISGDRIVGTEYTIDASADANNEYFISSSNVKIEGNGDATFGEYTFQLLNDAVGLNGLRRESNFTNISLFKGTDANGHGGLLGIAADGDIYLAPISSSLLSGGSWNSFARELRYSLANDRWEFDTNVLVKDNLTSTGTVSGSQLDSSGNTTIRGNLTVLGDTTISGSVDGHPDITQGSNISVNGSNGVVIQDLTISLDENGHVTTSTAGTVDLDNRYVELAGDSMTGTLSINGTLLKGGSDVSADTGPAAVVEQIATATYDAAFFDFVIKKTTNLRAGTVYAIHDGAGNVEFTETSTQDLGDTSDVTLSVDVSGGNIRLLATTTTDGWTVKAFVRGL